MENEEENEQIFRQLKKQKSVQIVEDRSQIVEIREKHGPLYKAIPKMHVGAAVLCCLFNIVVPGFGTLIAAFTVLCGAPTALNKKIPAFLYNLLSAFLQMVTFILIVGWVWSILWGMNMVTLARFYKPDIRHFIDKEYKDNLIPDNKLCSVKIGAAHDVIYHTIIDPAKESDNDKLEDISLIALTEADRNIPDMAITPPPTVGFRTATSTTSSSRIWKIVKYGLPVLGLGLAVAFYYRNK